MKKQKEKKAEVKEATETKETTETSAKHSAHSIESAMKAIKTKFGDEAIMKLGDKPKVDVDAIPTGSIGLDCGARHRRTSPRTHHRNIRPGIIWQDDARASM